MSDTIVQTLEQKWEEIVSAIPDDLEASAREEGALLRHRGFRKASDLLRVLLMYATLLSLRNTALWAACLGICALSRQALQQRILGSANWLRHLLAVQLTCLTAQPLQALPFIRRLILMDASVFARPGSPGTEWRLHLGWQPFHNQPAEVLLTDAHEGEGLDKLSLQEGDLVIADRAYGLWRHIQYALDALAFFLVRLSWCNLPLLTPDAQPFDLVSWLRSLPEATPVAEVTVLAAADPQRRPLRLVAGRLPPPESARSPEARAAPSHKGETLPPPQYPFHGGVLSLAHQSPRSLDRSCPGLDPLSPPLANRMVFPALEKPLPPRPAARLPRRHRRGGPAGQAVPHLTPAPAPGSLAVGGMVGSRRTRSRRVFPHATGVCFPLREHSPRCRLE